MKICRLISGFPSAEKIAGKGSDSSTYLGPNVYSLSIEQVKLGCEVHLVCKGRGTYEVIDGIQVHRVKAPFNLKAFLEMSKINRTGGSNILHVHAASGYIAVSARHFTDAVPLVAHVHGTTAGSASVLGESSDFREIWNNSIALTRERLVWKAANRVIAVSDNVAKELVMLYGIPKDRVRVVYNGVDTNLFKPSAHRDEIREKFGWSGRKVVLYVGQISPRKGLTYLVEAAAQVCAKNKNAIFALAGGVPSYQERSTQDYLDALKSLASKLGLSNAVVFLGPIPNSRLPDYYAAADLFVFPSLYEGLPKAMLEAMSCGKSCVGTAVGGIPVLVGPNEGIIVPPADSSKLAIAIDALLMDDEGRRKMGESAAAKIRRQFTWKTAAIQLRDIYSEIL